MEPLEKTIAAYEKTLQRQQECVKSYCELGKVLVEQGRLEEAIAVYQKAIGLQPAFVDSREVPNRVDDELKVADVRAEKQSTDDFLSYHHLGKTLAKQGKFDEAIAAYQKVIELKPDYVWSYYDLGKALYKTGQFDEAAAAYQKAISLNPEEAWLHYGLGEVWSRQNKINKALDAYRKAFELGVENGFSYYELGQILYKRKKFDEAIFAYKKAIELKPEYIWSHNQLGDVFTKIGQLEQAIDCYRNSIKQQIIATKSNLKCNDFDWNRSGEPQFIVIGFAKCGTTSLYEYIIQHPQILPAAKKEVMFFSEHFNNGIEWYRAHFPSIPVGIDAIAGEASAHYIDHPLAYSRVFKEFPKIKLIVLLRNPVERTFSDYQMWVRFGMEKRSFEEAILAEMKRVKGDEEATYSEVNQYQCPSFLSSSLYFYSLKRWMNLFPKENFLILQSEEFNTNPETTINQVFQFLKLPDYQLSSYPKYNAGKYAPISEEMRQKLTEYFRPHNQMLEEYLGMQFNWD